MNRTWKLTKVLMKNGSGLLSGKRGNWWKNALIILLLAVAFFPMISGYVMGVMGLYDGLAASGQQSALLGMGMAIASMGILIFALFYVLTVYYYSQDVEHLLPLPLKPSDILGAKFLVTLVYEYVPTAFLLLPLLITYGVKSGAGPLYYLYAAVVFLTLPVIPLVIASLVAMLFMRVTSVGKSRDRLRLISGVIGIAAVIGVQVAINRNNAGEHSFEQLAQMLISDNNALLSLVTRLFPNTRLGALALVESGALAGLWYLLAFVLVSAVFAAGFVMLGDRLYLKGVMGISETAARRRRVSGDEFDKLTGRRSPVLAFASKEWKVLLRTPAFFLNCVLSCFLFPLLVFIPVLSRPDGFETVGEWGQFLQKDAFAGIGVAVLFVLAIFMTVMNSVSATAFSRDGQSFFVNKYLPVSYVQIIAAKVVPGTILGIISMLLLCAVLGLVFHPPLQFLVIALLASLPGIVFLNLIGIMIDLRMPKLDWDSEQKAVKQNWNTLFSLAAVVVIAAPTLYLVFQVTPSLYGISLLLFGLFAVLDLVLWWVLVTKGPEWMEKIKS
ncbi:MAG: putative ABC transporter permease subunit [Brevibacillus sp.]|jgi:ABC-2 type transport system permease protein